MAEQLLPRTKLFALRVIKLVDSLPWTNAGSVLGKQLLRSATSVGANYRAARRARSTAEFCAKLGVVEEEADESIYWLELLTESGLVNTSRIQKLHEEANELLAMTVASIRTAKRKSADKQRTSRCDIDQSRKTISRKQRGIEPQ